MNILRRLIGGGPRAGQGEENALYLYVRCGKCGAPVAVRVDTRNEISTDYETGGRYLRKEMMDSTCFQLMYAILRFDSAGNIVSQEIERGQLLTRAEYEAAKAEWKLAHPKS
jgi:hypothetical protein